MDCKAGRRNRYRDARHVLMVAQITPGLPFPSICAELAAFNFTHIVHAEVARKAVAEAVDALSLALGVTFSEPLPTKPVGSARHYLWTALLPSGLQVRIVALAAHFDGMDEDAPASGNLRVLTKAA